MHYVAAGLTHILRAAPQRALVRARESLRGQLTSQVSPCPRTTSSMPRRKRAVISSGNGLTPSQLGANPVVIEMRRGRLRLDAGNVLKQFLGLNTNVRTFCEDISSHIGQLKQLPRLGALSSTLPENSPVGKPAHQFSSPEEYVFFVLLSIINTHIYDDIFRPFHPAASAQESNRYEEEYLKMIDTCMFVAHFESLQVP